MKHAPYHATLLALPFPVLAISNWSEPMVYLFTITWLAMFVIFCWALYKMERQLNLEGESLTYPWRVPSTRKETRRIDGVLATSIRRLRSGEDEEQVLATPEKKESSYDIEFPKLHLSEEKDPAIIYLWGYVYVDSEEVRKKVWIIYPEAMGIESN